MHKSEPSIREVVDQNQLEFSSAKIITRNTTYKRSNLDDFDSQLGKIKNANPYHEDPYDQIIRAKYVFGVISERMIEIGLYTQKELDIIFTDDDRNKIIERSTTEPAFADIGIYNDFDFSKRCALKISRESKKLIETYQPDILKIKVKIKNIPQPRIALFEPHFYVLRHIYINLGKLHALFTHFSDKYESENSTSNPKTPSSRIQYVPDVKKILLTLLERQHQSKKKKFKTIPAAIQGILADFGQEYNKLQSENSYKVSQNFFEANNLARNIRRWKGDDRAFAEALFEFIS